MILTVSSFCVDSLRQAIIELGDTAATVKCTEIDLTATPKQLEAAIRELDKHHGPFTHLFEVSGISNHIKDTQPWGLVSLSFFGELRISYAQRNCRRKLQVK